MITLFPTPDTTAMVRTVNPKQWGRQREGYPPGGPADKFSASVAARLAGNSENEPLFEIIQSRGQLQPIEEEICIALSGAHLRLSCDGRSLELNQSYLLPASSTLQWEPKASNLGYRSYLALGQSKEKRYRKPWKDIYSWCPPKQVVRILEGPETTEKTLDYLMREQWQISPQSNNQGIRLYSAAATPSLPSIPSAPVLDGTVQLTPTGPIILMRERQTVGGYPRIAQVIDCDIDMLAQYQPNQWFRFEAIRFKDAQYLNELQQQQQQAAIIGIHSKCQGGLTFDENIKLAIKRIVIQL